MANTRIYDIASSLLTAIDTAFTTAGVALPDRKYVHGGQVAYDCSQCVVEVATVREGSPEGDIPEGFRSVMPHQRSVDMTVHIVRKVCTMDDQGNPPSVANIDADSKTILTDTWVLFDVTRNGAEDETLLPNEACSQILVGPCQPIDPSGGFGGVTCDVTVEL